MSDYDDTYVNKQETRENDPERARVIAEAIDWFIESASRYRDSGDTRGEEWSKGSADYRAEEAGNIYDKRQELLENGDPDMQTDNPDKSLVMNEAAKTVREPFEPTNNWEELEYWDRSREAALKAAKKFDEVGNLEEYRAWQEAERLSERRRYSYGRSK